MSAPIRPEQFKTGAVPIDAPVSLAAWDSHIAPVLHKIEAHAYAIASHSTAIAATMTILELRPAWQTKAGEGVNDAIQTIENALGKLTTARDLYRAKPVMVDEAAIVEVA